MQPMNYALDVQQPFQAALSGMQAGLGLTQAIDQAEARKQDLAQRQYALVQQQQMQADLSAFSNQQNQAPSERDFAEITTKYPQLAEPYKKIWDMISPEQRQSRLQQATQVFSALSAGKLDIAKNVLSEQIAAARNVGDERAVRGGETMLKLVNTDPNFARKSAGLMLASVLGPEDFIKNYSGLTKLPSEVQESEAKATKASYEAQNAPQRFALENRNLSSQIDERSERIGLDRDKLRSDIELKLYEFNQNSNQLNDAAKKLINDATIESTSATQSAEQMYGLASKLESVEDEFTAGAGGKTSEWLKKLTGNQDYITQLRNEYVRIRNAAVVKSLPSGATSDADIAMAMKGFLPDNAPPQELAKFLRGLGKLQQYVATAENAKAEWINAVGHLGKPKQDITVDGVSVPAGSTFVDFTKQFVKRKTAQNSAAQEREQTLSNRSYMQRLLPGTR